MNSVCRTCLNIIKNGSVSNHLSYSYSGNEINDREKLETCVPELTVDIVLDPLMCNTCKDNLSIAFLFKIQCMETEKTLYNYIQGRRQNENCTDLLNNYDLLTLVKNDIISEHNYSNLKLNFIKEKNYLYTLVPYIRSSLHSFVLETNDDADSNYNDNVNDNKLRNEPNCDEASITKSKRNSVVSHKEKLKPKRRIRKTKKVQHIQGNNIRRSLRTKSVRNYIRNSLRNINDGNIVKKQILKRKQSNRKTRDDVEQGTDTVSEFNSDNHVQKAIQENEENVNNEIKPNVNAIVSENPYSKPKLSYRSTKRFQCTKCDKAFSYRCHFDIHLKSHIFKKLYSCPICEKSFSQDKYLKSHRLIHSQKALYQCALCNKCLSSRTSLQRHIKIHTGDRPFPCNQCGKRFKQKIQLAVHERTHTGSRPFICNVCNATFTQKCHLLGHIRIHTGEKPYECEKCMKRFPKTNALRIHLKIHEDKPYQCNGCTKFFRELSGYRKHVSKYLPKCVAGRRVYKAAKLKPKLPESKVLEEIDDDINEINMVDDFERSKKLTRLKYFCKVCNKGFTTNFSRNRHVKYQHINQ